MIRVERVVSQARVAGVVKVFVTDWYIIFDFNRKLGGAGGR